MAYRRSFYLILFFTLLLAGCGFANRSVETSGQTPEPLRETSPTPQATPSPFAAVTPVKAESTPTPIRATPTPFVNPNVLYLRERYQGRVFISADEWQRKFEEWRERRPGHPGILRGIKGLSAALRVGQSLGKDSGLVNDKWIHCVIGARVASEIDLGTAEYVAWLKEYQDLVDGFRETNFDEVDFEATLDGARQSVEVICDDCFERCEDRWGSRSVSWNGDRPQT